MLHDQRDLKVTYLRHLNFRSDFVIFRLVKNIIFNKREEHLSDHTCRIFCTNSYCETMHHWFFLLEISVAKIMTNLNVCSAHSYLFPWSRFNVKNCYGRNCAFIWYVSHMLLIRWNSDKDIWVGGQLLSDFHFDMTCKHFQMHNCSLYKASTEVEYVDMKC